MSTPSSSNSGGSPVRGESLIVPHSSGTDPPQTLAPTGATDCHIHICDRRFPRRVVLDTNAAEWASVAD